MKWKSFWQELQYIWLFTTKKAVQQIGMSRVIAGVYEWEHRKGKGKMVYRLTITRKSIISDLFNLKEEVISFYRSEDEAGYLRNSEEWLAAYDRSSSRLVGVFTKRQCVFVPEEAIAMVNGHEYYRVIPD